MMTGLVHKIMAEKQFGFIKDVKGDNYFFHKQDFVGYWSGLCDDFMKGQRLEVEFTGVKTDKGLRARNVKRME